MTKPVGPDKEVVLTFFMMAQALGIEVESAKRPGMFTLVELARKIQHQLDKGVVMICCGDSLAMHPCGSTDAAFNLANALEELITADIAKHEIMEKA